MGPAVSYCVRLCDGHFFPIQRSAATPVEICNSFCPAAHTKIFSGASIDHAVAHDGTRYADLSNAFVYRTRVVPGCSCNGKDAFGLVNMQAAEDPTLRHGDVVATADGFVAYSGTHKKTADFTPINNSASGVSAESRRQLAQTRIAPASTPAPRAGHQQRRIRPRRQRPAGSAGQIGRHLLRQRQRAGQTRRLDAEQVDEAGKPVILGGIDQKIGRRLAGTGELRPYPGVIGQQ